MVEIKNRVGRRNVQQLEQSLMNIDDLRKEGNDAGNLSVHTMQVKPIRPGIKANTTFEIGNHAKSAAAKSEFRIDKTSAMNGPVESSLKSNMNA